MSRHSNTSTTRPVVYSTSTVAVRQRATRIKGMHRMALVSDVPLSRPQVTEEGK